MENFNDFNEMTDLHEEITEILYGSDNTVDFNGVEINIYLGNPTSENYDSVVNELDELLNLSMFEVDGDYEGTITISLA